ncbi:DUF4229 domain-containing protein [Mycobacterium sp.]|uniref:DUF4229 domain-containing protein n=1 Tax=Mycobacterium sp. TaxID=1785 RepID=UPI003A8B74C8
MSAASGDRSQRNAALRRGIVDVVVYSVVRLLLVVAVTGVIYGLARLLGVADFPVVIAALFGIVIGMPLGIWVFSPLRRRATAALADAGEQRRTERDRLRARLRGEAEPGTDVEPEDDLGSEMR